MSRIAARFAKLKAEGRGALMPFVEAYDPDPATSMALLRGMPGAGADIIELGVPFSDPMADGPTVQRAGQRALAAGGTLAGALAMARDFRTGDDHTPIVLMGYFNPILSYGVERFCTDAGASGVDGLIIVDLPPEEAGEIAPFAAANGLDMVRLATPTSDEARLGKILEGAGGFIYYVAIAGVTGTRSAAAEDLEQAIPRIRAQTDLPIAIGFGVRTAEQAAHASRVADGAVVASALIDTLAKSLDEDGRARPDTVRKVLDQVRELAAAVHEARKVSA
ncbi:tryptophan synthase subunit alpha [Acetobacteraceae bacterium H6797]|nr:tryptophan synthase subunit alpha [Acetobacteraceae bacterium H6797]